MDAYREFASVYDVFMNEVPYDAWLSFVKEIWQKEEIRPQSICDVGCGTGNLLLPLAREGYDVMGVDISFDMLCQAESKLREEGFSVFLSEQDMTEMYLPKKVDCILCLCDSLNYLVEDGALSAAFGCFREALADNGLLFFDLNTAYKFSHILGQNTFAATEDDAAYIWENDYDEEERINEYAVNFFLRRSDGSYTRTEEFHYERAFLWEEVEQALKENGFAVVAVYEDYTFAPARAESERICIVARPVEMNTED